MTPAELELQAVESEIRQEYLRFHEYDPSYRPVEVGRLGSLWAQFDWLVTLI